MQVWHWKGLQKKASPNESVEQAYRVPTNDKRFGNAKVFCKRFGALQIRVRCRFFYFEALLFYKYTIKIVILFYNYALRIVNEPFQPGLSDILPFALSPTH